MHRREFVNQEEERCKILLESWHFDKGWFKSRSCLVDFMAVHAPQLSKKYWSTRPYKGFSARSTDNCVLQSFGLESYSSALPSPPSNTPDLISIIEQHGDELGGNGALGMSAATFNKMIWNENDETASNQHDVSLASRTLSRLDGHGWARFDNALTRHGLVVLRDEQHESSSSSSRARSLWVLPISTVLSIEAKHLERLNKKIQKKARDAGALQSSKQADAMRISLYLAWVQLQFHTFHLLVMDALFELIGENPDDWYDPRVHDENGSSDGGLSTFINMLKNDDPTVRRVQTYAAWWWRMFSLADLFDKHDAESLFNLISPVQQ